MPMPHPNRRVDLSVREGVIHTIEGSLESGLNVFREHYSPHITGGLDRNGRVRCIQHIPIGYMAAALQNLSGGVETNFESEIQIEIAGFSKDRLWLPEPRVVDMLAELFVVLERVVDIPLSRPFGPNPGPKPWASNSYHRRHSGQWGRIPGWYMHMEVPENEHWDAGYFDWNSFMRICQRKAEPLGAQRITRMEWKYGRWYFGLAEFARFGAKAKNRRPSVFPQGGVATPGAKAAVKWYKEHVVSQRRVTDRVRTLALSRAAQKASPAALCVGAKEEREISDA
jgi:hypothetical protein